MYSRKYSRRTLSLLGLSLVSMLAVGVGVHAMVVPRVVGTLMMGAAQRDCEREVGRPTPGPGILVMQFAPRERPITAVCGARVVPRRERNTL